MFILVADIGPALSDVRGEIAEAEPHGVPQSPPQRAGQRIPLPRERKNQPLADVLVIEYSSRQEDAVTFPTAAAALGYLAGRTTIPHRVMALA